MNVALTKGQAAIFASVIRCDVRKYVDDHPQEYEAFLGAYHGGQQTRLKKALQEVAEDYDYVLIDNAPDLNMSVINALVATDDVLIPIKVDSFSFDGVAEILDQIEEIREFNAGIRVAGGFITMYQRNKVNALGQTFLQQYDSRLPMFSTVITTVSVMFLDGVA